TLVIADRQLVRLSFARAKKLARAAECLVYSLTPSGFWAENHPKNRGFVGILRGQKCLKRCFSRRSRSLQGGIFAPAISAICRWRVVSRHARFAVVQGVVRGRGCIAMPPTIW